MKNEKQCPFCSNGKLKRSFKLQNHEYQGFGTIINQSGEWCDTCGEGVLNGNDLKSTSIQLKEFTNYVNTRLK